MTVTAQNPVNSSTANGVTTVFPYTFKITDETDLKVIVDGVEVVSGFTISGVGNEGGGNVTFSVAPANGLSVVRIRDMTITRDTDYQEGGDLLAETLDADIDRAFLVMQQINEAVGRSYKQEEGAGVAPTFPAIVATQYLRGTSDGLGLEFAAPAAWAAPNGSDVVGFIQAGSGATNRTVQDKLRESVSVKDFGAIGDGVTDASAAILLAVASGRDVFFPAGTYIVKSPMVFSAKSGFSLRGAGQGVSTIKLNTADAFTNSPVAFDSCSNFSVSGLTFDCNNNASLAATFPTVIALSSSNFLIEKNEFIRGSYIDIAVNSCTSFVITRNMINRDTALTLDTWGINVSSTVSTSTDGLISHNIVKRAPILVRGSRIIVDHNSVGLCKYGAGISTSGDGTPTYGQYLVTNNICYSNTGLDGDGVNVAGFEFSGYYSVCSGNIAYGNGGAGIAALAYRSKIEGNTCFGNGVNVAGAAYQSGILMGYVGVSDGAHYCNVTGNSCFDIGGGVQLYGYYEQSASLVGNSLSGNKLSGNVTGSTYIQGTQGTYDLEEWISYTPTMTSTTGTITTVGACTGRYKRSGKIVHFKVSCTITTNGTGATLVQITLPAALGNVQNGPYVAHGRENGVTGKALVAQLLNGTTNMTVSFYDATYPGANGAVMLVGGFYEVA